MEFRICRTCNVEKPIEDYHRDGDKGLRKRSCKKCRAKDFSRYRRGKKRKAVAFLGGSCRICGYSRCVDALEFHHVEPSTKSENWNSMKKKKWDLIEQELLKCVLLCANCHREVHESDTD